MHELHSQSHTKRERDIYLRTREIRVFRSQTPTFNWPKQEFCTPYIFIIKEEYLSVYISFPSVVLVIYNLPSIALLGILYFIFRLYGCVHSPLVLSLSLTFPIHSSTHPLSMLLPHGVRCVWQWNRKKSYTAEKNTERFLFFVFEQGLKLSSCSFSLSVLYFPPPHYTHGTTRLPSFFFIIIIIQKRREMLTVSFIIAVFLFSWGLCWSWNGKSPPTMLFFLFPSRCGSTNFSNLSSLLPHRYEQKTPTPREMFRYKNCGGGSDGGGKTKYIRKCIQALPMSLLHSSFTSQSQLPRNSTVICVHGSMINKARSHASTALSYDMRNALCCQHTYTQSSRHFSHQKHSNTNVRLKKMRLRRYFCLRRGAKVPHSVCCMFSEHVHKQWLLYKRKSYLSPLQLTLFFIIHRRCCRVVCATTLLEKRERERTPQYCAVKAALLLYIYTPFTTTAANIPLHFTMMPTLVSRKNHYTLPSFPYNSASSLLVVVCLSLI